MLKLTLPITIVFTILNLFLFSSTSSQPAEASSRCVKTVSYSLTNNYDYPIYVEPFFGDIGDDSEYGISGNSEIRDGESFLGQDGSELYGLGMGAPEQRREPDLDYAVFKNLEYVTDAPIGELVTVQPNQTFDFEFNFPLKQPSRSNPARTLHLAEKFRALYYTHPKSNGVGDITTNINFVGDEYGNVGRVDISGEPISTYYNGRNCPEPSNFGNLQVGEIDIDSKVLSYDIGETTTTVDFEILIENNTDEYKAHQFISIFLDEVSDRSATGGVRIPNMKSLLSASLGGPTLVYPTSSRAHFGEVVDWRLTGEFPAGSPYCCISEANKDRIIAWIDQSDHSLPNSVRTYRASFEVENSVVGDNLELNIGAQVAEDITGWGEYSFHTFPYQQEYIDSEGTVVHDERHQILIQPELEISKRVKTVDVAQTGGTQSNSSLYIVDYELEVKNDGASSSNTIFIYDELQNTGTVSNISDNGIYDTNLQQINWELPSLSKDESKKFTYTVFYNGKDLPNDTAVNLAAVYLDINDNMLAEESEEYDTVVNAFDVVKKIAVTPSPADAGRRVSLRPLSYCTVDYKITNTNKWNNFFAAEVIIENTSDEIITGWNVEWEWPNEQELNKAYYAVAEQNGKQMTVKDKGWNSVIMPGESRKFIFNSRYTGENRLLVSTDFKVNGNWCSP